MARSSAPGRSPCDSHRTILIGKKPMFSRLASEWCLASGPHAVKEIYRTTWGCSVCGNFSQLSLLLRNLVLTRRHPRLPVILGRNISLQRVPLALLPVKVLLIRPPRYCIVIPEQPALPQLWNQQLGNILERLRKQHIPLNLLTPHLNTKL
jgi:hypothetical protein